MFGCRPAVRPLLLDPAVIGLLMAHPGAHEKGTPMRRLILRSLGSVIAGVALLCGTLTAAPAAGAADVTCSEHRVPISLGAVGTHMVSGTLCGPSSGVGSDTVQILVPGSTYDHTYWDFPISGYSYARYAAQHGQTTFALDRFNTGNSDRLPSAVVTVLADAATVHQVAGKLRRGEIGGKKFRKVITVGHSLGSIIVLQEAAQYRDVDGLMLTGFTHTPSVKFMADLATGKVLQPAPMVSPDLADQPLGDFGANCASRERNFYAPGNYDPAVVAEDCRHGTVITAGELATFPLPTFGPHSELVTAPVMLAMGTKDTVFFCGLKPCHDMATLRAAERHRFPQAESIDFFLLPNGGHDLNLALNRTEFFQAAVEWVDQVS